MEDESRKKEKSAPRHEMVKREQIDELRGDIARLPFAARHYGESAIQLAESLLIERDNVIAYVKALLMSMGQSEKEALAIIFSRLHGPTGNKKVSTPYDP